MGAANMTYIDAHTHLDHCKADPAALVAAARAAGVETIIQSGTDAVSSRRAVELAERFPEVWATVGFHPHDAKELDPAGQAAVEALVAHPRVLAVGEVGLDYHYDHSPQARQREVFAWHVGLAARAGLPLVVHTREADDHTLDLLAERAAGLTVVLHCFSMPERLEDVVARGYYLSFAGNVTFPKAAALQAAARAVPAERLLLETDAPYLTPMPHRGRPNTPALVAHTYAWVAGLRGVTVGALAAQVRENAVRAYPRLRLE
ncbi:MAG: TatD family hydrolase [Thermoleophilia bacterium]